MANSCLLPETDFRPSRIDARRHARTPVRLKPDPRSGLSLFRIDACLAAHAPAESKLPAYAFRSIPTILPARSASNSIPRALGWGTIIARNPLPAPSPELRYRSSAVTTHPGLPSEATQTHPADSRSRKFVSLQARSLFAPRQRLLLITCASGSSFRARYLRFDLLFRSRRPRRS